MFSGTQEPLDCVCQAKLGLLSSKYITTSVQSLVNLRNLRMAHRLQTRVLKTQQLPKQQQQNCLKSSSVAKAEPGGLLLTAHYLLLLLPGLVSSQLTHLTLTNAATT